MKNILLILALLPMVSMAQITDKLFAEVSFGLVEDIEHTDKDINLFSPDMSSSHSSDAELENGFDISIGYQYSEKIAVGFSYLDAEISGSNDVEYFQGEFTDMSAFIQYDLYQVKNIMFFADASLGQVEYEASRFLVSDDSELPINSPDGTANKMALGLGAKMAIKDNMTIVVKYTLNELDDDGFDGWDYGSDTDRYAFMSVGLRMKLSK
ncbi:MAG: outer membrane beta-barrel protein [Flavobacteriales bacterium]|tara:strand:+ start:1815 stop:2444 length:630 start_codon:yes stop_codon:yes gene_type:complete